MPTLITSAEKEKIKRAIPKASNKVIDAVVARLYIAYPDPNAWTFTGVSGAVALVNDLTGNTFFLKIVDIIGNRGVIWDQELYVDFQYNQDRAFFHTFELEECYAGLLFADDTEAHHFLKKVQHKDKYASKATLNNKNAIALKKPEKAVQGPRGDFLRYQKLGNNYTLASINNDNNESDKKSVRSSDSKDDDVDPSWKNLVEKLQEMGITEEMLASNADILKDYIRGGGDGASAKYIDKKAKGPPPPPPLQPPTSRTSATQKAIPPLQPLSKTSTPPPPAPEVQPVPAGPLYKVPPPFNPATLPNLPPSSRSPAPRPSLTPSPSNGYSASPAYSSTPSPEPKSPAVSNAADNRRTPAPGHKYNVPPPFPTAGSAMAPRQPLPGSGQQLPARAQPPILPSRDSPGLSPVGSPPAQNVATRPVPAPPSLPPRVPVQNGLAPVFAQPTGHGPMPPPPPPHKHGSRTAVQNTTALTPPLPPPPNNRTSMLPTAANTANPVPPRPPPPPASYNNPSTQRQSSALPPPPPPPPVSYTKPAVVPQIVQQPMQYSAPAPVPPTAFVKSTSSAPPPPLSYQNSSTTDFGPIPPSPPPPPPLFEQSQSTQSPAAGGERNALMASIRGSGGVGHLKSVDKSHLERSLVISQPSTSDTSRGSGADTPGNNANLQDALAAALSKRKTRVAGSGKAF
ncbi:uncharacterized protein V1513DRAFT_383134 [Lipomyces chichibuensis]|uniref:uncharacterized protein n=1 Tax=Lipomyces chichibuensis TaxID=1546026 RepID=UPI003343FF24